MDEQNDFPQTIEVDITHYAITMKFIEEHQQLLNQVFETETPEDLDLSNSGDHSELEELNPSDAIEIAEFSDEVENWTTWKQQSYFYVCKVTKLKNTYLLFAIHWDDNWGKWERQSWGAVEGIDDHKTATSVLLKFIPNSQKEKTLQILNEMLEEEIAEGFGEDDFVIQNLRRQINAEERNETFEEMYKKSASSKNFE